MKIEMQIDIGYFKWKCEKEDITLDELKELLKSFSSEEFYKVLDSLYQEKGETKDDGTTIQKI